MNKVLCTNFLFTRRFMVKRVFNIQDTNADSRNQTGSHRELTLMNANKKLASIRVY